MQVIGRFEDRPPQVLTGSLAEAFLAVRMGTMRKLARLPTETRIC